MIEFLNNPDTMACVEALSALSSFLLALVIFLKEISKKSIDSDLSPIRDSIEEIIVNELPSSLTKFLINYKNVDTPANDKGDTIAEVVGDELNSVLHKLPQKVDYLKYVKPFTYEAIKRKDDYLRSYILKPAEDINEKKLKKEVHNQIIYLNRLLKGKPVWFLTVAELLKSKIREIKQ